MPKYQVYNSYTAHSRVVSAKNLTAARRKGRRMSGLKDKRGIVRAYTIK